ncbi:MAG TPA: tetratricopeptide repeat protein [Thermoanaerobaculia bacterium]|jgi:Tfp pilus assembly protein PilF|nr:tetratricopeptide repeat protein [Thermoanaerobaculia bacterium]
MDDDARTRALNLWEEGTQALLAGDVDEAIDILTRSLEVVPTAEGYTFRGWAYSFQGRFKDAIEECKKAIATDPSFGNPYNDIGSYLVHLGEVENALPWFGKAKRATRYEPRHFPYLNVGRIHAARGEVAEAILEFTEALRLHPGDPLATAFLTQLAYKVN